MEFGVFSYLSCYSILASYAQMCRCSDTSPQTPHHLVVYLSCLSWSCLCLLTAHFVVLMRRSCSPADPNEAKHQRLIEMGFESSRVRAALAEARGDEGAAVSKLLQG